MGNLGDILAKKMKQLGIERQVEAVGVVEKAAEILGKKYDQADFDVISFKDETLKIKVRSSSLAAQMQMDSNSLLREIKEIKKIRFVF